MGSKPAEGPEDEYGSEESSDKTQQNQGFYHQSDPTTVTKIKKEPLIISTVFP